VSGVGGTSLLHLTIGEERRGELTPWWGRVAGFDATSSCCDASGQGNVAEDADAVVVVVVDKVKGGRRRSTPGCEEECSCYCCTVVDASLGSAVASDECTGCSLSRASRQWKAAD
jgi:hypothetical protein